MTGGVTQAAPAELALAGSGTIGPTFLDRTTGDDLDFIGFSGFIDPLDRSDPHASRRRRPGGAASDRMGF
ncbi:MAG: hypothetical protein AAFX50_13880, partial [Acidobacteriota bacterium]